MSTITRYPEVEPGGVVLPRDRAVPGRAANRMQTIDTNLRRRPDYWILAAVFGLCLVGLIMVYSASYADGLLLDPPNPAYFALKQVQNLLVGAVLLVVFMVVPYQFWRRFSVPAMGLTLLMLIAVLIAPESLSPQVNGAHRWLLFMQPSEL